MNQFCARIQNEEENKGPTCMAGYALSSLQIDQMRASTKQHHPTSTSMKEVHTIKTPNQ
jgi:hypothetical protein